MVRFKMNNKEYETDGIIFRLVEKHLGGWLYVVQLNEEYQKLIYNKLETEKLERYRNKKLQ